MGKYFGTDGFRGEANVTLTARHALLIGRFLARHYGNKENGAAPRVVIGKDTRRSGDMLEAALTAGLTECGAKVTLLHVTTTPNVAYTARTERFDCGIMISASHNPYYDNGIKLLNGKGEKMEPAVLDALEAFMDSGEETAPALRGEIGQCLDGTACRNRYVAFLHSLAEGSLHGKKVALDCANGSASAIAERVFAPLGAELVILNDHPDGLNINENCGSTHLSGLQETVRREKCDIGLAFDGDADRCLAVDETGAVVDGDRILYVLGMFMKAKGTLKNNTVVTTVMSNFGLYRAFDREGIAYEKTQVGDKYVYENMKRNGHALGGEQSGHIIVAEYETTGDGLVTAMLLLNVLRETGRKLSELAGGVTVYPQLLKNVRVADKEAAQRNPAVLRAVEEAEGKLGGDGRMLLRASGTEPLVRVMAEAATDRLCEMCVDAVIDVMKAEGLTV